MNEFTIAFLFAASFPLISENNKSLKEEQHACFAVAMIGYDYVINARAGLPIERALNTVSVDNSSTIIRETYKYSLKPVVKNAYLWQDSPHTYAISILYSCAFNQGSHMREKKQH